MDDFKKEQLARHSLGYPFKTGSHYSLSRRWNCKTGKGYIRPEFNRAVKRSMKNKLKNELMFRAD